MSFPKNFLWGAASAAHQVEGGNINANLWELEWMENSPFSEPSGDACDSLNRYREDIELLASSGLNTYRFSIEWARVEPEKGYFSRAALDHYRRMIGACLEQGVTPMVTYHHFTTPKWFAKDGGWRNPAAPDLFARYAARVTEHIGDLVPWICTINEANITSTLQHVGIAPAGHRDEAVEDVVASSPSPHTSMTDIGFPASEVEVMAAAHRKAVDAIRSGPGQAKVGWTLALVDLQAAAGGEQQLASVRQKCQLDWLNVSRSDDFIGVQTYTRETFGPEGLLPVREGSGTTQTGWEIYPEALEHCIRLAAREAAVPVVVTENGMATDDDDARINYTHSALRGVHRCLDDGVDVQGYMHWTLLDNYEWTAGFAMKFGLISVNRDDFSRSPKPSLKWLGGVARHQSLPESDEQTPSDVP